MANKRHNAPDSNTKKYITILYSLLAVGIIGVILFFYLISTGVLGYIPSFEEIENPSNKYASLMYSSDGEVLGRFYYSSDNRMNITFDELSPKTVQALIATEDVRFAKHSGIDGISLIRVLFKTLILQQGNSGGGSTISQQLAKLLYTKQASGIPKSKRVFQKFNEYVIAAKLERSFTKEEILTMYLNKFDFLNQAIGIKTAAHVYFHKLPAQLNEAESAVLIGMLKNPSRYNPLRFPENAIGRRNVVLQQMQKAKYITKQEYTRISQLPLGLNYQKMDFKVGPAPYLREYLRNILLAEEPLRENYRSWDMQRYLDDSTAWVNDDLYGWCTKHKKADGSTYNLYTDGLKIYTTIDSRLQENAVSAMTGHLSETLQPLFFAEKKGKKLAPYANDIGNSAEDRGKIVAALLQSAKRNSDRYISMKHEGIEQAEIDRAFNTPVKMQVFSWRGDIDTVMTPMDSIIYMKHFLRAGFMAMDPATGYIKAYVGGPDYRYFQYDMVTYGRRQVGSTIKPFLYTLAMQQGFTPCTKVMNEPVVIYDGLGRPWSPKNAGEDNTRGQMVTLKYGLAKSNNFISSYLMSQFKPELLANLIKSMGITSKFDAVPAMCLGTPDFTVKEMTAAYSVFANKGVYNSPILVTRIEDENGNTLATFEPKHREVLDEKTAYTMVRMLEEVVNKGTGYGLRRDYNITGEIGGKTGTTQDNSDGWFMCITPKLVAGCWVGGEERGIRFNNFQYGQGAKMALPIMGRFLSKTYLNPAIGIYKTDRFDVPTDYNVDLDCGDEETAPEKTNQKFDFDF